MMCVCLLDADRRSGCAAHLHDHPDDAPGMQLCKYSSLHSLLDQQALRAVSVLCTDSRSRISGALPYQASTGLLAGRFSSTGARTCIARPGSKGHLDSSALWVLIARQALTWSIHSCCHDRLLLSPGRGTVRALQLAGLTREAPAHGDIQWP